jgi:co-chaperonin GroES (HSP10)
MQIINDFFMISVDQKYESTKTKAGILTLNTAHQNNEEVERFEKKRVYGFVETCPLNFTYKIVDLVDPGVPAPRMYIGSDYIEEKAKAGHKMSQEYYSCATWDGFDTITTADIAAKCDIRRGDKVYFGEWVTEPDNELGKHKGRQLYKAEVIDIICSIRDGEIIMQGDWCLVEPNLETWEEISIPTPVVVNGKPLTNPDGSVRMRPKEEWIVKKSQPENKPLEAFMRHFSPFCDLEVGDKIIYNFGANWPMKIEGKDYLVVKQEDVLCKQTN